jgi:hypothetical protein
MSAIDRIHPSPELWQRLRSRLDRLEDVTSFVSNDCELAGWVASIGIQREVGTVNDELARFVFDAETGTPVPRDRFVADLIRAGGMAGVRIRAAGYPRLDLRVRGLKPLIHPASFHSDGSVRELLIFPEAIARILALEGIEVVLVKRWGQNTIFGGFDPARHYYQTNLWELENNDTLLFSRLLEKRRLAFLGTHDLVAHIAGAHSEPWGRLAARAAEVSGTLDEYFARAAVPTIASLVMPYTAGVILDDLAQPPNYDAVSENTMLDELLAAIRSRPIDPAAPRILMKFPSVFEQVIRSARAEISVSRARELVTKLAREILADSLDANASRPRLAAQYS